MESALQQEIQRIAYENCKPERVSYVWRDVPTVDEPKNPNPEREKQDERDRSKRSC